MVFELIKYKYGTVKTYTALCLTPTLKESVTSVRFGKEYTYTNEGSFGSRSHHFQTPEALLGYLRSSGHELLNLDLTPIQGTAFLEPSRKRKAR